MCRFHSVRAELLARREPGRLELADVTEAGPDIARLALVPLDPPGPHEQDVALRQRGSLRRETLGDLARIDGVGLVVPERPIGRLPPPGDVGEHGPTGDATSRPVMDPVLLVGHTTEVAGAGFGRVRRVVADVTEAVPLARRLRVPSMQHVIVSGARAGHLVLELPSTEQRRIGKRHRPVEGEHRAAPHEPGRRQDPLGRQQVEAAEDVVVAPHAPCGPQPGPRRKVVVVRECTRHRRS